MQAFKALYSVNEIAEILSLGRTNIYKLIAAGKLQTVTIGRARRVPNWALEAFLNALREEATNEEGIR